MTHRFLSTKLASAMLLILSCLVVPGAVSLASEQPNVVLIYIDDLASQHAEWSNTLAPLGEVPRVRGSDPIIPTGHGWAFASSNKGGRE